MMDADLKYEEKQIRIAGSSHLRGWKLYMQSNFPGALVHWRRAWMIRRAHLGSKNLSTKESADLVATVLQRMGWSEKEKKRYMKDAKKATEHEAIGDYRAYCGKMREAEWEYKRAWKTEMKFFSKDHPLILSLQAKVATAATSGNESASLTESSSYSEDDQSVLLLCDTLAASAAVVG